MARKRRRIALPADENRPTQERFRQGEIQRETLDYLDPDTRHGGKHKALVYRAVDTVARLLANKTITENEAAAARTFQARFHRANLQGIRASGLERVTGSRNGYHLGSGLEGEHQGLWRSLRRLGWPDAQEARVAYHVLGLGMSIREYAANERWRNVPVPRTRARDALVRAIKGLTPAEP